MNFEKLNQILESQIDKLSSMDIFDTGLMKEIDRGRTVARLAKASIDNTALVLNIEKYKADYNKKNVDLPSALSTGE